MELSKRKRLDCEGWRVLVARQAASGLSVAAFCTREGLSAASFYQWRTRLRGAAGAAARKVAGEPPAHAFVDLGPLTMGAGRVELRIDLGGGVVLQLSHG